LGYSTYIPTAVENENAIGGVYNIGQCVSYNVDSVSLYIPTAYTIWNVKCPILSTYACIRIKCKAICHNALAFSTVLARCLHYMAGELGTVSLVLFEN